jgi:hypothetical protein
MFVRLRRKIAWIACSFLTASGFATGIALGCSAGSCTANVQGCTSLSTYTSTTCCVGGSCRSCKRYDYDCHGTITSGPPVECGDPISACS